MFQGQNYQFSSNHKDTFFFKSFRFNISFKDIFWGLQKKKKWVLYFQALYYFSRTFKGVFRRCISKQFYIAFQGAQKIPSNIFQGAFRCIFKVFSIAFQGAQKKSSFVFGALRDCCEPCPRRNAIEIPAPFLTQIERLNTTFQIGI